MDEDSLKQLWANSTSDQRIEISADKLIESIDLKLTRMDRNVKRRDRSEIFLAALFILLFGWWIIAIQPVLAKIGAVIIFINCILVIRKLLMARKVNVPVQAGEEIKNHLNISLKRVQNQIKLHNNIFWWYLLPFFIGIICIYYGYVNSITANAIYTLITAAIYGYIWRLNINVVKNYLKPLEKNILDAIQKLTE
jgi:hypothetical protein